MMLRHLVFILLLANVPAESSSTVQKAPLASEKSQSLCLKDAVVNTQIFTMFRYKGRQVYVYSALSNDHGNVDSPRKWIFYYVPVVMAALGKDLNGNLSTAWIVGNDVRVNILLGSTEVDELARKAVMKKHKPDVAKYAEYWDVAPLMIDSLTAYVVKESSNPVEGVHPFIKVHPNDLILKVRFPCHTREKAEMVLTNLLDGIYEVEIAFFFGGFRRVSTNSVSITGGQLKNVFNKAVADGGNMKALYIHRSQSSKFVDTCISNVNIVVHIEDQSRNPQDQHNDLVKQFISILQQGMAGAEQIVIEAKHWDQVWSPADLNPDKITLEMNNNFIYNENETKKHNSSDTYFDRRAGSSSSSTEKDSFNIGATVSGRDVGVGMNYGKSNEKGQSNSQEQAQVGRQTSSLTEINHDLKKRHLQLEWTGEKLIPKSFSVVRLTDLEDSLQVQLSKKNFMAEKTRGAIVHTLKGLHKSDIEDSMAEMHKFKNNVDIETYKNESKAEIEELKKRLDDAKHSQNSFMEVIQQMNVSLQETKTNAKTSLNSFMDVIQQLNVSLQEIQAIRGIQLFQYSAEARRRAEGEEFADQRCILCSASGLFNVDTGEQGGSYDWSALWRNMVDGSWGVMEWRLMMPHPADNLVVGMSLERRDDSLLIRTQYLKNRQRGNAPPQLTIDCEVSLIIGNVDGTSTTRTLRKQHKMTLFENRFGGLYGSWSEFVTFPAPNWEVVNPQKPPTVKIQLTNVAL